jgi:ankyrin repeat protein
MSLDSLKSLRQAFESDDIAGARQVLERVGGITAITGENGCSILSAVPAVRSVGMADLLLAHGLTTEMVAEWWAPGFGLSHVSPEVAEHLMERGAAVTVHTLAALGLKDRLREMVDRRPDLVHAKGGDGCRPLHFARDVPTAQCLLEHEAELDPRDDDHDSTPAQWRIGDAPDVTRLLLGRGAKADIFMAAGLGDLSLAKQLVADDLLSTTFRIGNNAGPFPGLGFQKRGGTIYQWTLGFNLSPHEIAFHRGHQELFRFLMDHTPARQRLLVACMLADRSLATDIVARSPGVLGELDEEDHSLLAKCCWETNLNRNAVRLMLDLGFPVDAPERNHGYLPLHNAAWCGDPELVSLLLEHGHPVDRRDPTYHATALGFALHSFLVAKRHPDAPFPRVVELLLAAGVPVDEKQYPTGNAEIDALLRAGGRTKSGM